MERTVAVTAKSSRLITQLTELTEWEQDDLIREGAKALLARRRAANRRQAEFEVLREQAERIKSRTQQLQDADSTSLSFNVLTSLSK